MSNFIRDIVLSLNLERNGRKFRAGVSSCNYIHLYFKSLINLSGVYLAIGLSIF